MDDRTSELRKRVWFTVGALVVSRLGVLIPIPGLSEETVVCIFGRSVRDYQWIDDWICYPNVALDSISIFALGILPYLTAVIIIQLTIAVSPQLKALRASGEAGRRKIAKYTRYGTVLLCIFQSYGIAVGFDSLGEGVVIDPGPLFRLSTVMTMTAGAVFLMWLAEQIDERGIGPGAFLILAGGIVAHLGPGVATVFYIGRMGSLSTAFLLFLAVAIFAIVAASVAVARAYRCIEMHWPRRPEGFKREGVGYWQLRVSLSPGDLAPPILVAGVLMPLVPMPLVPIAVPGVDWGLQLVLIYAVYGVLLIILMLLVGFALFNPVTLADRLERQGYAMPGLQTGKTTESHLAYLYWRVAPAGALLIALICTLMDLLLTRYGVPLHLGGTNLLILTFVTIEVMKRITILLPPGSRPPGRPIDAEVGGK